MPNIDHRLARRRARWRRNSKRYRQRNPKHGPRKVVLRFAAEIERLRYILVAKGKIGRDASIAEIEFAWAKLSAEFVLDLEAGRIFRHR